jgi:cytochrome b involved in lipid metabolism
MAGCSTPVSEEVGELDSPQQSNAPETPKAEPGQEPTSELPQRNAISWSKVEENVSMESCWIVLRDEVYDFSQVVQQHPFGQQLRMAVCGKDATETFQANADINEVISRLEPFYLGPVG